MRHRFNEFVEYSNNCILIKTIFLFDVSFWKRNRRVSFFIDRSIKKYKKLFNPISFSSSSNWRWKIVFDQKRKLSFEFEPDQSNRRFDFDRSIAVSTKKLFDVKINLFFGIKKKIFLLTKSMSKIFGRKVKSINENLLDHRDVYFTLKTRRNKSKMRM